MAILFILSSCDLACFFSSYTEYTAMKMHTLLQRYVEIWAYKCFFKEAQVFVLQFNPVHVREGLSGPQVTLCGTE